MKQLWSECYSQREILNILLREDFEITDRDVTLLRQNLGLRMRDPNSERRARAIQGSCVQTTPEDLDRLRKRCQESDERLILGTRRIRTRTWNGIPADDPDLEPRFPSERTISACKKDLNLDQDRKKYIFVRDTFQRMCTEAGIIKKSHDPEAWEKVKLALVDTVPFLNQVYSRPSRPKKGDPIWFALDIICSDVAKKIRVLHTKLDIKQVKQTLRLDPHEVTSFRRKFVEILRDANFKSRFDVPIDDWDRLKKILHSGSPHLQAVLPTEVWDHKNDKRVKAFEYLCRDVTKRYKDRRGNSRKTAKNEEVIKAEHESPVSELQAPPYAEPESPFSEVQELPLAEPKGVAPIAPELLAPRSRSGELANQRPVLRYTAEGFATVAFEPESSGSGKKHQGSAILGNSQNELHTSTYEVVQNPDDLFSGFGTLPTQPSMKNDHLSTPIVHDHDDFMYRLGPPPAFPIAQKNDLNVPIENGHDDFMRRFEPSSPIAFTASDHFDTQILEDHATFAHQFGYGTPPHYSFMENNRHKMSAMEGNGNHFSRDGFGTNLIFPITEVDYSNMPNITEHSDHLCHLTENHLFPQFRAQPELPIMENSGANVQIMQSIEVDSSFENGCAESCQGFEYPDPADCGL